MPRRRVFAEPKKEYFHIPVKPKHLFKKFRAHDVGKPRGLIRVAGVRKDTGKWNVQKYLLEKKVKDSERGWRAVEQIESKHDIDIEFPDDAAQSSLLRVGEHVNTKTALGSKVAGVVERKRIVRDDGNRAIAVEYYIRKRDGTVEPLVQFATEDDEE